MFNQKKKSDNAIMNYWMRRENSPLKKEDHLKKDSFPKYSLPKALLGNENVQSRVRDAQFGNFERENKKGRPLIKKSANDLNLQHANGHYFN